MKIQAIIPTAGLGKRLKSKTLKPFIPLKGKAILAYTLRPFQRSSLIDSVIVVAHAGSIKRVQDLIKKYKLTKVVKVVPGGKTRTESVSHGLRASDADTDLLVIHDGARPFLTKALLEKAVKEAQAFSAAVVAVPVKQTIKVIAPRKREVKKTLNRDSLWEIQTPQIFKREILVKAYQRSNNHATDDAALVERLGVKVKIVMGDYRNIKITTREDLEIAKAFL
ncbi:MAG: 2-C-methyl-D-erythritol 4-phosphate cytidylyltransferase [Omnitrophica WOR_2 bacterium GWA2_47_8]|nr:MAG: 2-C-methyl-D-erythritol 4-phosphate cytidylyltransferase [Omnitrophica WOR_2 bacterium GWA2_47_8]